MNKILSIVFVIISLDINLLQISTLPGINKDKDEKSQDSDKEKESENTPPQKGYKPSPEPSLTDTKQPREKILEGLERKGGKGKKVVLIPIEGVIDLGLSAFVTREIEENRDASAFILEIDTPGGRVDAALKIRDALLRSKIKTVAFIHPRAISAGALISYACDVIAISTGGSIGAATPIALSGDNVEAVDEKMLSYFRAEMASTARAKGRRGDIAEAMVDKDIAIEGITEAGKLLTLDTDNALRLRVADIRAESVEEVLDELYLEGAEILRPKLGWAENIARWITHPIVSGLLMTIGILAILIELYHPGFGAPGIVGISCLALFFFGHHIVRLAGLEELVLLGAGIVFLIIEFFVFPGHIIFGVLGVVAIIASLGMALLSLPLDISFQTGLLRMALLRTIISIVGSIILFIVVVKFLPKIKFAHPIVEKAAIVSRAYDDSTSLRDIEPQIGDEGIAESPLRPSGRGSFKGKTFEVIAEGSFIDSGSPIVVVNSGGGKIVVREKS